jgi:PAS domain S-box-containing protein
MNRGRGISGVFQHKLKPLPWLPLFIFLLLIAAIAVSGYFYYQKQKKDVFNEQIKQLKAITDLKAAEIQYWLGEKLGDARLITENRILATELLAFLRSRSVGPRQESIRSWMESLRNNYHYQNVLLLDGSGEVVLALKRLYPVIGSEGLDLMEAVRHRKEAVISDLHRSEKVNFFHLDVAAPLLAADKIAGFVILRIDPAEFLYPMIKSWPTPSPSAETLLVRREGDKVLYLNELRHRKNSAMKLSISIQNSELPAAQAVLGKTGAFSGRDYRGVDVWSVLRTIPDSPWFIVAKIDREEIEQPIRRTAQAIFLVTLSMIMAAALMILYMWQRQKTSFRLRQLEALQESEDKFKYVFDNSLIGKSITLPGGEINVNKAFCDMLGYSAEEMKARKWRDLTHADDVETTQKALDLIVSEKKGSLRFEKRYVHKNGSIVWADVSTSLRRDRTGKPLYFMTAVIDITERKQGEEKIRHEQDLYMDLVNTIPSGMYRLRVKPAAKWDEKNWRSQMGSLYSVDFVSDRYCKITGISRQEFAANPGIVPDRIHPDEKSGFVQRNSEAVNSLSTFSWEGRMIVPQKGAIWVRFESIPRKLENGEVLWTGIVNDISERKRAEQELVKLSSRNQAMLEAIPDIIMEVNTDKVYTWANHAGIKFFGADAIGKEASFYFEGEQKTYLTVKPIFNGQEDVLYVESWQRRRDNEKRLLAWWCRVLKDAAGNVTGALSSARDITEIQRAEDALRESERKFRETVINLDEGYYSVTLDGELLDHNQAFNRIFGFDITQDLKGSSLPDFWQEPEQRKEYLMAFAATGSIINYQINAKTQQGKNITVLASAHMVKDVNNQPQRIEGIFLDISERIRIEAEIRSLNEELEQRVLLRTAQLAASNKELEAFSYSVSHDLRAPLRAIDGFSRIVLEEYAPKLDDEGRRLLDVITVNTRKMGHLIDDLLAFSRLSRQQMAPAPINLAVMAKVVFSELKSLEKGRRIEFIIGALPTAHGDYSMLYLVLQNLLANAIKFTRKRPRAKIELAGQAGKDENIYQVKDNGVGFDMEYVDKLFGVFQRLHGADEFEGTGVGLAIVQRIVQRHGGRVWAESAAKGGATFFFSLPAEKDKGSRV